MHNRQRLPNTYFWRTYDGKEIDYLEEEAGQLTGFECKWKDETWRPPQEFLKATPAARYNWRPARISCNICSIRGSRRRKFLPDYEDDIVHVTRSAEGLELTPVIQAEVVEE